MASPAGIEVWRGFAPKIASGMRMRSPTHVAAVMIRAALSACIFSSGLQSGGRRSGRPHDQCCRGGAPDAPPAATPPQARVYLFRGALGPIFSRGMDRLTDRLEESRYPG